MESAMVTYGSMHPTITRSQTRHIYETTHPEYAEAQKLQDVSPSVIRTKRQRLDQVRVKPRNDQLSIEEAK
ncbi:hypothetical protein PC123_g19676 [Phytophthora cactorum]|nr:hypothetical protein PC123_g19676 [Phytophthora cactorum]